MEGIGKKGAYLCIAIIISIMLLMSVVGSVT